MDEKDATGSTRHPVFYYEDGSIILNVQQTLFRIHQSLLSRQSEVFRTMFSLPEPDDAPKFDGCPVIGLEGDSLQAVEDVLKTLYDPFHFDELKPDADLVTMLDFLSGILRFSTKYDLNLLRKKCINVLLEKFPTTLAGCDDVLSSEYRYKPKPIIRAIALAQEANVPQILPWAYYICTHMTMDELMNDSALSWKDKALCLAGKERLWQAQKTLTHKFLFVNVQSPQCNSLCQPLTPVLGWKDTETYRMNPHPLQVYTEWSALKLCSNCLKFAENEHKEGRTRLWNTLPEIFQLGRWEDILGFDS